MDNAEYQAPQSSFGGDVADFLGTLRQIETGETYWGSINPNGNPFEKMTPQEMIEYMQARYPSSLDILSQRLDDFYGISRDNPNQNPPEVYQQTHAAIQAIIEKRGNH